MQCPVCAKRDLGICRYPVHKSSLFAGLLLAQCRACGLGWVPVPGFEKALDAFYRDEYAEAFFRERTSSSAYYREDNPVWSQAKHRPRDRARKHAADVKRFAPIERVLDIGAGVGLFLHAVEAKNKYAVELDQHAVRILQNELGVTVQADRRQRENYFDLVMASHSLEHFTYENIFSVLDDIKAALRPKGIFYLEVPSGAEQLADFCAGERRNQRMEPHTLFFSSATLMMLLRAAGFDLVEAQICSWTRAHLSEEALDRLVGTATRTDTTKKNLVMIARKPNA